MASKGISAPSGILLAEPQNDHYHQWNGDEHGQGNLVSLLAVLVRFDCEGEF
jgi:hypothetical protein